tara:strand:- start:1351 stop:1839 length:489 start_codon:yes stop_codon:yes gene_type:complete
MSNHNHSDTKVKNDLTLIISRSVLALLLLIVGLSNYHGLFKLPLMSTQGEEFILAMQQTGYLYWTVKIVETVTALAILAGLFVPLATLFVFPIIVNILLFHIFVAPGIGIAIALVMLACSGYIFYAYRGMFKFLWRYNMAIDPNSFRKKEQIPRPIKHVHQN